MRMDARSQALLGRRCHGGAPDALAVRKVLEEDGQGAAGSRMPADPSFEPLLAAAFIRAVGADCRDATGHCGTLNEVQPRDRQRGMRRSGPRSVPLWRTRSGIWPTI